MKTARRFLAVVFATLVIVGLAQAQVNFYVIEKAQVYVQTSSATPSAHPTVPFLFSAQIEGTAIGSIPQHAFTLPGIPGSPINIPPTSDPATRKQYQQNFTDKGVMDTAFPNGAYLFDVDTVLDVSLTLAGTGNVDLYPSVIPKVIGMTNGAFWNGSGQLMIDPTLGTTLTLSTFTEYNSLLGGQVGAHIGAFFYSTSGPFTQINQEAFTFNSDPSFNTFVIGALTPGDTYQFEMEFNVATTFNNTSLGGAKGVALFTDRMIFDAVAIPEPSTYAAIFGALALAGVMIVRRRRTA